MSIASTAPFQPLKQQPLNAHALRDQLIAWNLQDDLAVKTESDGKISVYAREGAQSWPYEWTPNGDDVFEAFELADFLSKIARGGQSIQTDDAGGSRRIYVSTR